MRFFYYFTPLFFLSVLFCLYLFPAVLEESQPFLRINGLCVSSLLNSKPQGSLQAKEWISSDFSFSTVEAKGVNFNICQSNNSWRGYVGHLCQDSLNACTYLQEGVLIERLNPRISLQGSAFLWEENSFVFRSLDTKWVIFKWQESTVKSRRFFWNQETGELSISGDVEGVINVSG